MDRFCVALAICSVLGCSSQRSTGEVASRTDVDVQASPLNLTSSGKAGGLEELIAKVEPSVVRVNTKTTRGEGIGSGFVVRPNVVVTNYHVIDNAQSAEAVFPDGKRASIESVLSFDQDLDIAVLRITGADDREPIPLSEGAPRKGEAAIALGAPKGLSFTVTEGIVSAVRPGGELKEFAKKGFEGTWIQTSASVTNGNSGGPLINRNGRVIGMNTFIVVDSGNLAFALSAEDIKQHLNQVAEDSKGTPLPITAVSSLVERSSDMPTARNSEFDNRKEQARLKLASAVTERREELQHLSNQIDSVEIALKQALIEANDEKVTRYESQIHATRKAMLQVINSPLKFPILNRQRLATLEIGYLGNAPFTVVQVLNKESGTLLVMDGSLSRGRYVTLKLSGVDLIDVTDGEQVRLSPSLLFVTTGTYTYTTVAGSDNTIFELICIGDAAAAEDFKDFLRSATRSEMIGMDDLNEVEKSQASQNRQKRDLAIAEEKAQRLVEAQQSRIRQEARERAMREVEAERKASIDAQNRIKRAKSHLELGIKIFATNPARSKRYFETVIQEDPNSDAAKEAAAYLKRIK